jgi:hypothetical protein
LELVVLRAYLRLRKSQHLNRRLRVSESSS